MSWLKVYSETDPNNCEVYNDEQEIASKLEAVNVGFSRWHSDKTHNINSSSSQEEIISAYQDDVDRIMEKHNFKSVDVINMSYDSKNNQIKAIREKFLQEHIHTDDEVRYFIDGQGLFYIHAEYKVYAILCCKNDFISVPANLKHWFDMGEEPDFKCIRFFSNEAGWVAQNTGDKIADYFPKMELSRR